MLLIDLLYLINVAGNMCFINVFLGYEFTTFGMDVVRFLNEDPENRTDPMMKVFPRVTKCSFHTYGPSGTIQNHDAMCVLPINIVNEKIYVFLWFWLIILSCITAVDMVYQTSAISNPNVITFHLRLRLRKESIKRYCSSRMIKKNDNNYTLNMTLHFCKFCVRLDIDWDGMRKSLQVGDWKLLYILSKNMESMAYEEFLYELSWQLKKDWTSTSGSGLNVEQEKPILKA